MTQYKMTQYNILNVKLSNSQLNKLKLGVKNNTEVTLKLSSNIVDILMRTNIINLHTSFKAS